VLLIEDLDGGSTIHMNNGIGGIINRRFVVTSHLLTKINCMLRWLWQRIELKIMTSSAGYFERWSESLPDDALLCWLLLGATWYLKFFNIGM